jgi:hypothetical protein
MENTFEKYLLQTSRMISTVPAPAPAVVTNGNIRSRNSARGKCAVGMLLGVAIFAALTIIGEEEIIRYVQFSTNVGSNKPEIIRLSNDSSSLSTTGNSSHVTAVTPPLEPQPRIPRNITLIVELRGELGNHLSVLANARITQLIAQRNYPHINIRLIGQHQSASKWKRARDDLVRCFPNFLNFEFEGGIHDIHHDFAAIQQIQKSWLSTEQREKLTNVKSLAFLDSLLYQQEQNISDAPQLPPTNASQKYSLPYLTANAFSWSDALKNEYYYNDIRKWMRFNETACCNPNIAPESNEIVFHYRNYATEMKRRTVEARFVEATPLTAANALFLNTSKNCSIGISSRFESGVDPYVQALRKREISSHYVDGQRTGMEAFCYLMQAQYETVGVYLSTFFRWASFLGNATMNRHYMLDQRQIQLPSNETVLPLPSRTIETIQHEYRTFKTEVCWQPPP